MAVFDHPSDHLRADRVAKGLHSTQHCINDVCGACVACEYGFVHIPHGGLWSNGARAISKTPHSHSLPSNPEVIHERSKTLHGTASARKDCTGGGGGLTGGWRPRMGG